MTELFEKFRNRNRPNFLDRNEHLWIQEHRLVKNTFSELYSLSKELPKVRKLIDKTIFIQSNGQYASAISADINIIIIYPELLFLMKHQRSDQALAILLHEIGHIILEHQRKCTPNDQAQIEADLFAASLGHGLALTHFLQDQTPSKQVKKRLLALSRIVKF